MDYNQKSIKEIWFTVKKETWAFRQQEHIKMAPLIPIQEFSKYFSASGFPYNKS